MGILKYISLRQRFLLAPLIGVLLAIVMYLGSDQLMRSNATLLQDLHDTNLPQISEIGELTVQLSANHSRLTSSLIAALEHGDEELVYLAARENLFTLHDIEQRFPQQLRDTTEPTDQYQETLDLIRTTFALYREAAIGAIELSTVDADRAKTELLSAHASLTDLNRQLLAYADEHMDHLRVGAQRIEASLGDHRFVGVFSAVLILLMIAAALFFSKRMSSGIDDLNKTLIKLAKGDTNALIKNPDDHYLKQLADVAMILRSTLLDNQNKRAELAGLVTELKDSEHRFSSLLDITATAIIVIDEKQEILLFNRAAELVFGHGQEIIGQSLDLLIPQRYRTGHVGHTKSFASSDIRMMGGAQRGAIYGLKADGTEFPIEVAISKLSLANQTLMTAAITDITLRRQQEEKILHQAHFDHLTGLPNRFLSLDRLEQMIKEARRADHKVAALFLDLDDFKKVNDTLNHDTGDLLLIEIAKRLQATIADGDTVGRLGGDEFLMLIGGIDYPSDVQLTALHLLEEFNRPIAVTNHELRMTVSIGIALFPDDGDNAAVLMRNADVAMYAAKQQGRNTYSFFTGRMNQEAARRLALDEQMHGALERAEFSVEFQPLYMLRSRRIIGFEALLRWQSEVLGPVSPGEFIPIAEQSGLIVSIGEFVIEKALSALASVRTSADEPLVVSINLSPIQLRDNRLLSSLESAAHRRGVDMKRVELEVTEGVFLGGRQTVLQSLSDLSALGVGIAMDDFGTGYASLSYLRSYPFDKLKIDRQFICELTDNAVDTKLVKAAIDMAHGLGLQVVAEGVETEVQLEILEQLGCDIAQGYLISKPLPLTQLQTFVSEGWHR